jgi:hypothetical protein
MLALSHKPTSPHRSAAGHSKGNFDSSLSLATKNVVKEDMNIYQKNSQHNKVRVRLSALRLVAFVCLAISLSDGLGVLWLVYNFCLFVWLA